MGSFLEDVFSPASGMADLAGGDDAVFGTKPKISPFIPTDLSTEQAKAVAANLENFPEINDLLNKYIPNFNELLSTGTEAALDELRTGTSLLHGELPPDVQDSIQRSSAYKSLMGGFLGTPMNTGLTLRDFGRTSLDVIPLGSSLLTSGSNIANEWANVAEGAASPFIITTPQQAAVTAANNAGKQATEQFKFNVAAAPDPAALGKFNTNIAIGQQIMGIVGGMLGGGGGQTAAAPPVQPATYSTYAPMTNWQQFAGVNSWSNNVNQGVGYPPTG